jgi:hypothetical protein
MEMNCFFNINNMNVKNNDDYVIWIFKNVRYIFQQ